MTTQYIPHWEQPATVKDLTFKSVVETAAEYVPKLREEADLVVVATMAVLKDLETGTHGITNRRNEGYDLLESSGLMP